MPIQIVGRSRSINSSCSADGVVVPEPAQLTAMPRRRRGARQHLADRMDAERKRHMRAAAASATGAIVNSREADHRRFDVAIAARIEQRRTGRAAGAPIFGDAVVGRDAEALVKLLIVEFAQHLLVQDRNFAPLVRIVEPVRISRYRACLDRTARGAPARARASCARIECARSRPVFSAARQAASCRQDTQEPRGGSAPIQRR